MAEVRRAVLAGRRLRLLYAATGQEAAWRTVDPVGLVTATRDELVFQDLRHAHWAVWRLGAGAEALAPSALRVSLHAQAVRMVAAYR